MINNKTWSAYMHGMEPKFYCPSGAGGKNLVLAHLNIGLDRVIPPWHHKAVPGSEF